MKDPYSDGNILYLNVVGDTGVNTRAKIAQN